MPESLARQHDSGSILAGERHTVLYIDTALAHVASMRDLLGSDGIDLITAPTGEAGVRLAHTCRPDLILLELASPATSEVDVVTLLRLSRQTCRIPIVALSGVHCQNVPGLSMYCRRPIAAAPFRAMLRALLEPPPSARCQAPVALQRAQGRGAQGCRAGTAATVSLVGDTRPAPNSSSAISGESEGCSVTAR